MQSRAILATILFFSSVPAFPAVMSWHATMSPANEVLADGSPAPLNLTGSNSPGGSAQFEYDDVTKVLSVFFSWSGLTGTANAAHVHCCTADPPFTAGVVLGFWNPPPDAARPPAGSYSNSWDLDTDNPFTNATFVTNNSVAMNGIPDLLEAFESALMPALTDGRAYINIHTTLNPGGEIRGDFAPTPEPSTALLILGGAAAVAVQRRLRKRAS